MQTLKERLSIELETNRPDIAVGASRIRLNQSLLPDTLSELGSSKPGVDAQALLAVSYGLKSGVNKLHKAHNGWSIMRTLFPDRYTPTGFSCNNFVGVRHGEKPEMDLTLLHELQHFVYFRERSRSGESDSPGALYRFADYYADDTRLVSFVTGSAFIVSSIRSTRLDKKQATTKLAAAGTLFLAVSSFSHLAGKYCYANDPEESMAIKAESRTDLLDVVESYK